MKLFPFTPRSFRASGAALLTLCSVGCASRNYTYYLIEPDTKSKAVLEEEDTLQRPFTYGTSTVMKVRWNDGEVLTEVDLPLLSTGQRIVIEHATTDTNVQTLPSTRIVAPPPTAADNALVEAYRARGLRIDDSAPDVSLAKARAGVQEATRAGNYTLALEWIELVLARYPSHPEFLRAKGSVLLMMGERPRAIEVYEKAEEIESDPAVRQQLDKLQAEGN
ncbi:MAG: tetratricopeptide repeat protein [Myxococcota bacterium]